MLKHIISPVGNTVKTPGATFEGFSHLYLLEIALRITQRISALQTILIKTKYNCLATALTGEEGGSFSEPGWGSVLLRVVWERARAKWCCCLGTAAGRSKGGKDAALRRCCGPGNAWSHPPSPSELVKDLPQVPCPLLSIQNSEKAQNWREITERNQEGEKGSIKCKYGYYKKKKKKKDLTLFFLVVRARSNYS